VASTLTLETVVVVLALTKILLAMVWLAVLARNITMGVAWHRFTAWFNIYFKRNPDRTALGALEPLYVNERPLTAESIEDLQEEDFEKLGVSKVEDLSWKGLLEVATCTECGRCQSQCPACHRQAAEPLLPGRRTRLFQRPVVQDHAVGSVSERTRQDLGARSARRRMWAGQSWRGCV
jgi:ferredoxin